MLPVDETCLKTVSSPISGAPDIAHCFKEDSKKVIFQNFNLLHYKLNMGGHEKLS